MAFTTEEENHQKKNLDQDLLVPIEFDLCEDFYFFPVCPQTETSKLTSQMPLKPVALFFITTLVD